MIRFPFVRSKNADGEPEKEELADQPLTQVDAAEEGEAPKEGAASGDEVIQPAIAVRIEDAGFDLDKLTDNASSDEPAANGAGATARVGVMGAAPLEAPTADADPAGDSTDETPNAAPGNAPAPEVQARMVEAMLFASEKPLSTTELSERMPVGCDAAIAVRKVEEMYAGRGVTLVRVAGKWAFRTAPDLSHLMQTEAIESRRLSRAAIETLAIVAYNQPVTRAEIEEIRQVGVSRGTIDLLMELEWIKLGRRRQTPGRPVTFVTTDKFMEHFGLESIKDLPGLEELRQSGLLESRPAPGLPFGASGEDDEDHEPFELDDEDEDEADDQRQQDLIM